jgi:DNA-binding NtrC family response regulator
MVRSGDGKGGLETTIQQPERGPASRASIMVIADGAATTHALPESGDVVIGRAPECDVCIAHASLSRRHAVLHVGSSLTLEDLGSANGTRVRGEMLQADRPVSLDPGEVVDLGSAVLVVRGDGGVPRRDLAPGEAMRDLHKLAERIASGKISVLILGETGVGKEVLARTIHDRSPRADKPFLPLNCSALSESLLESELFGHEKGAFTGADRDKPGLLETADGGTVFLDEIGELPTTMQVKLLRVLEERRVMRVGGVESRAIDVRFVAATHRDVEAHVAAGTFRQDLYFRLNGASLVIPPLRERTDEIEPLARAFAAEIAEEMSYDCTPELSRDALDTLRAYRWPGNIRELRNVIERAVLLAEGTPIARLHLPTEKMQTPAAPSDAPGGEKQRVIDALAQCAGNQSRAAKLLGISRRTLVKRLDQYGIPRPLKDR